MTAISGWWGSVGSFSSLDLAAGCCPFALIPTGLDKEAGTEAMGSREVVFLFGTLAPFMVGEGGASVLAGLRGLQT